MLSHRAEADLSRSPRARAPWIAALAAATVAGGALRMVPYSRVVTPEGVQMGTDSDPHYHVIRAERILRGAPGAPWFDPDLSAGVGAHVLWPPLFDLALARVAGAAYGPEATRDQIAYAASWVPPILGTATIPLVGLLAAQVLPLAAATWAAAVYATAPVVIGYSRFGRPDHHAAEPFLLCAMVLLLFQALRAPNRLRAAVRASAAGLVLAAALWTWHGASIFIFTAAAMLAAVHAAFPRADVAATRFARAVFAALCAAAAAFAASVAWARPPQLSGLQGLGPFQTALLAGAAAWAGIVLWLRRTAPSSAVSRAVQAALAATACLVLACAVPGVREALAEGVRYLGASNPWYASIGELRSVIDPGRKPLVRGLLDLYGYLGAWIFAPLLVPAAAGATWAAGSVEPTRRVRLVAVASAGLLLIFAMLARVRLVIEAGPFVALAAGLVIATGETRTRRLVGAALGLSLVVSVATLARPSARAFSPAFDADARELFSQLRDRDADGGRRAVLAEWNLGLGILYFADRPVVSTAFGTDVDGGGFVDWAAWQHERDPARAQALLDRRRVGHVVVEEPSAFMAAYRGLAREDLDTAREEWSWRHGTRVLLGARYLEAMAPRLFHEDGAGATPDRPGLPFARLVWESAAPPGGTAPARKLFEVVRGARVVLTGLADGTTAALEVPVTCGSGRTFTWRSACAARDGSCAAIVPFATGTNGDCAAGEYVAASEGLERSAFCVSAEEVAGGLRREIAMRRARASR